MKKISTFFKDNYRLIVPITIIAIPFLILIISLISASLKSGKVINGNRYRNDLNPKIENSSIKELEESISSMSNIEEVEIVLKTSQLRVTVDVNDSLASEEYEQLLNDIYNKVNTVLPITTYFTKNNTGEKMYDIEITAYNNLDFEDTFIMYSLVKNSTMEEPIINLTSDPKDPELVEELILKEKEKAEGKNDTPETTPQFEEELEEDITEDTESSAQ